MHPVAEVHGTSCPTSITVQFTAPERRQSPVVRVFFSAKYHPSGTRERIHTWGFSSDAKIKYWDTNIYDLCHVCGHKHVLYHGTRWQSMPTTQVSPVAHRLPAYTADAFRHNDWKCKCQSSAESFSAHRLKARREPESSRDVNWLKKSEGGLPGVCHAHFENLRTGVKARTAARCLEKALIRELRDGTASHLTITILLWPSPPTAPELSRLHQRRAARR